MASEVETTAESASRLRRIELELTADESFEVPHSDGYPVYGALLGVLDTVEPNVSAQIHDGPLGSLHSSGLIGTFGGSDRRHHKTIRSDTTYELSLGVIDPEDEAVFQALVSGLVLEGDTIELSHGTLRVESFESSNTTHAELIDEAGEYADPEIEMEFQTPTCIEESGEVTTLFPHRWSVFNSLLGKWNQSCPDELTMDLSRVEVEASVIEKPDPARYDGYCLDTHSVLVSRGETESGETRNIFRQGFTGTCTYDFKDASESLQNAVTSLALFGEYSGVGSAVARGCGNLGVEIEG